MVQFIIYRLGLGSLGPTAGIDHDEILNLKSSTVNENNSASDVAVNKNPAIATADLIYRTDACKTQCCYPEP